MTKEMIEHQLGLYLSSQIRQLRLQRRWTRAELAKNAGINIFTLKHFERSGQISLERLLKICRSLDLLDELMRVFKPRKRIDINNWTTIDIDPKRGRRRVKHCDTTVS